jgi:alpha-ribazole phosphatase
VKPPTRLFLVRHGEVAGDGVLHGHVDVPLTPAGVRQMQVVAARLEGETFAAVYSSDLERARHSARIVADLQGAPRHQDPAFREMDMGDWDNRAFSELWQQEGDLLRQWWGDLAGFVVPGGESLARVRERVLPALAELLARHAGESICLVAHGGVNRIILLAELGSPLAKFHRLEQDYGCVNLIEYHPDGRTVVKLVNG